MHGKQRLISSCSLWKCKMKCSNGDIEYNKAIICVRTLLQLKYFHCQHLSQRLRYGIKKRERDNQKFQIKQYRHGKDGLSTVQKC